MISEIADNEQMLFKLSFSTEYLVLKRWSTLENFEAYLNDPSKPKCVFQQKHAKFLAGELLEMPSNTVVVCGQVKLIIAPPHPKDKRRVPVIRSIVNCTKDDRNEAFGYPPVETPIKIAVNHR